MTIQRLALDKKVARMFPATDGTYCRAEDAIAEIERLRDALTSISAEASRKAQNQGMQLANIKWAADKALATGEPK